MKTESDIVDYLISSFPDYIGDDAAVLPLSDIQSYLITKDLLVEGIHFRLEYQDAVTLAHKALHVNMSDIAAMGGLPKYVLLGISTPQMNRYCNTLLEYFVYMCETFNVILIGGDIVGSSNALSLSVTMIGTAPTAEIKFRKYARLGDAICIVGDMGYAHIGLNALEKHKQDSISHKFVDALLKPNAKVNEGIWLRSQQAVSAMIDTSDGLISDLTKLCKASNVAARINLEEAAFSIEPQFQTACNFLKLNPLNTQLTGGEDYGLLFTVNPGNYEKLAEKFMSRFGYRIKYIGQIVNTNKTLNVIQLIHHQEKIPIPPGGFMHF